MWLIQDCLICCAGLGRAPATALAYMYWCRGLTLQDAISTFMAVRPCNPRIVAIRQATIDILIDGSALTPVRIAISRTFGATSLQVRALSRLCCQCLAGSMHRDSLHKVAPHQWILYWSLFTPGLFFLSS